MKYIGIAGKNGFGVFDNDKRLANSEDYLIRNTSKTFDTFWEAFCFASGNMIIMISLVEIYLLFLCSCSIV